MPNLYYILTNVVILYDKCVNEVFIESVLVHL